jgi:prepilin-type N-terminal cleavage/methylation domain-containing protein
MRLTLKRNAGFTLPEVLVASGIGAIAFGILATSTVHLSYIMYGLQNYITFEEQSQTGLETMARDIREADSVASATATTLVLNSGTNQLTYSYDSSAGTLTRTASNSTRTLVKNCTQIQFNLYQRCSQTNTYGQFPAATVSQAKLVEVIWRCGVTNAHNPGNTAFFHATKVVIRKE